MHRAVMQDMNNSILTAQDQQQQQWQQSQQHHQHEHQQQQQQHASYQPEPCGQVNTSRAVILVEDSPQQYHHNQQQQQQDSSRQESDTDATVVLVSSPSPSSQSDDVRALKAALVQPSSSRKHKTATSTWGCCAAVQELKVLLLLGLPTIITTAAQQLIIVSSQMFSGHIGTDEMAAAALSNTWWNLMWYILLGASTAFDTLGSQAVGARDKSGLVVWSLAAAVVLTVLNIPMTAGLWYAGDVARHLFGQGPEVVALVDTYSRWLLPGLWPMTMAQLLQKYLQTQGIVGPPAITSGLSIIINITASWFCTEWMGLRGVAIAATATRVLLMLMMVVAVMVIEGRATGRVCCAWWSRSCWKKVSESMRCAVRSDVLWTYLALGIPGGIMLGLECASFEVTTALAGYLGPAEVAAHAGVFAITSLCYIALPFALATAATIRVGNLLGAGRGRRAATASRVVVCLGSGFMAICGLAIYFGRRGLGEMFTAGDPQVLTAIAMIAPLGAAYQVFDGVLGTSQGVLRGLGRQAQLMLLNMVCFWLIGVPCGYYLTFKAGWGLRGLWVGMSLGGLLAASVSLGIMLAVDWNAEVEQARKQLAGHDVTGEDITIAEGYVCDEEEEQDSSLVEPLLQNANVAVDILV